MSYIIVDRHNHPIASDLINKRLYRIEKEQIESVFESQTNAYEVINTLHDIIDKETSYDTQDVIFPLQIVSYEKPYYFLSYVWKKAFSRDWIPANAITNQHPFEWFKQILDTSDGDSYVLQSFYKISKGQYEEWEKLL